MHTTKPKALDYGRRLPHGPHLTRLIYRIDDKGCVVTVAVVVRRRGSHRAQASQPFLALPNYPQHF